VSLSDVRASALTSAATTSPPSWIMDLTISRPSSPAAPTTRILLPFNIIALHPKQNFGKFVIPVVVDVDCPLLWHHYRLHIAIKQIVVLKYKFWFNGVGNSGDVISLGNILAS